MLEIQIFLFEPCKHYNIQKEKFEPPTLCPFIFFFKNL